MYWCRPAGVTAAAPEGTVTTFVAPPSSEGPAVVWHDPARRWAEGRALPVEASVATAQEPDRVVLHFRMAGAGPFTERPLEQAGPYRFRGEVPAGQVKAGEAEYCLTVDAGGKRLLFPGGGPALAKLAELSRRPEVVLADFNDQARASRYEFRPAEGHKGAAEVGSGEGERSALRLTSEGFGEPPSCCAATVEATPLTGSLEGYNTLCLRARGGGYTSAVEVVAVQRDGRTYGANALLTPRWETAKLPFDRLAPMWQTRTGKLDPAQIKEVRLTFGAWLFGADRTREHMVEVSRVWLAAEAPVYTVPVERRGGPVTLFDPALEHVRVHCDVPFSSRLVRVPRTEDQALRAGVEKFGPAPSCLGFRVEVDESVNLWREEMEDYNTLVLRARGAEVATDRVEIVLIERDGAPWGTNVPLSGEWQEVAVPLKELRYWTNWGPKVPGRGGTEDHLRPEDVAAANVCFGAWLYPEHAEEPHTVEIGAVKLERR
jgi:hypothetical protein